jgi:Na+-translocating ferredoxin:NAD+ oxidoreductase subunit G
MAGKESTFLNMVLTLFLVTLAASAALGYIYEITKGPIAEAKLQKKINAISLVVPEFDNNPNAEMFKVPNGEGDSLEIYPASMSGQQVGYAVKTFTKKGFSGLIELMVGFNMEGKIHNISVLFHAETPGLGDKMTKKKSKWSDQYNGKDPASSNIKVKQDGGEIDAITASTISSRAYSDAVNRAYAAYSTINQ